MFVSILASGAANEAVKVLARGGMYIAGGVVTHMLETLQRPAFRMLRIPIPSANEHGCVFDVHNFPAGLWAMANASRNISLSGLRRWTKQEEMKQSTKLSLLNESQPEDHTSSTLAGKKSRLLQKEWSLASLSADALH